MCKWNFTGVSKYKYPYMYKLGYEGYKEEGSTVSQNRSIAPSKIGIYIFDNRHLPVGCSTLTPSDVTSEPITSDPTTQLTKVFSIL